MPQSEAALIGAVQDEIARCALELLQVEPFFGHLFANVVRVVDLATPTAGVRFSGGRFALHINGEWFLKQLKERKTRVAIIKHELLHILLQHVTRFDAHTHDRFRYGLAADLVVNQLVLRWPLPPDALMPSVFPGFPDDLSLEGYDELLQKAELGEFMLGSWHSDHLGWGVQDEIERSLARVETMRLVRHAWSRCQGKVPGKLAGVISELVRAGSGSVDWRQVLQRFARSAAKTSIASTLRRPSRRYHTWPGTRVRRQWWIVVAIDTSGSIEESQIARFTGEVRALVRAGAEVTVIECDAEIQRVGAWSGQRVAIHGRGGTRFEPVMQWLGQQRPPPDACIYLTDGRGPSPITRPSCPLLWVIPPDGSASALRFGRVLRTR